MKRSSAIITLLAGMLLFFGSCAPLGYSLYQNLLSVPVATLSLSMGEPARFPVEVAADRLARVAVRGRVETHSVQEESYGAETTYKARFRFPVNYSVTGSTGNVLISEQTALDWNSGSVSRTSESVDSLGGFLTIRTNFKKFPAPSTGEIMVDISVGADGTYGAGISDLELLIFDGLAADTWYVITGIAMLVIGAVLAILGFIFTLTNAAVSRTNDNTEMAITELSRQRATWIHLSGFLGYFVPMGNVIGPLILWISWRDTDEFINEAGREALNFQLTVIIYVLVSLLLAVLLIGFLLLIGVAIFQLVYMIIAAVHNSKGEPFHYPMIFRFIK